jgi:hypothetical protein
VIMCLKLALVKKWDCMKVGISGAFLCAKIDKRKEVFLQLDRKMTELAVDYMPELREWVRQEDQTLFVRVDKAMYGLIQSPKLWYKELTSCLMSHGFKICKSDECILHKIMKEGKHIVLILHVDDILIMSGDQDTRVWVRDLLQKEYDKITFDEEEKFTYLGMALTRTSQGYEISIRSYIEDILEIYGRPVKECVTPAKGNLFATVVSPRLNKSDREQFHSTVVRLLYLGKRGRPDILLLVQCLCTRVKESTEDD